MRDESSWGLSKTNGHLALHALFGEVMGSDTAVSSDISGQLATCPPLLRVLYGCGIGIHTRRKGVGLTRHKYALVTCCRLDTVGLLSFEEHVQLWGHHYSGLH